MSRHEDCGKHAIRPCKFIQGMSEEKEWEELAERVRDGVGEKRMKGDMKEDGNSELKMKTGQLVEDLARRYKEVFGEEQDEEIKDGDVEPDELVEDGRRKVKKLMDPKLPSKEEVKEHYASGHMPYRSWCHHCARG